MKWHRPLRNAILLAALVAMSPSPALAQDAGRKAVVNLQGTEFFRVLVHRAGLKPLKTIPDLGEDPDKTLLIVFGDPRVLAEIDVAVGLKEYLKAGGALLVATIYRSEELGNAFGIRPQGSILKNLRQGATFRNKMECPFVVPSVAEHPIFRDVTMIATNAPTYLICDPDCEYFSLATFLPGCRDERNRMVADPLLFAVGNSSSAGKLLVLGGHGTFMNGPIANRDNTTFARNCIDWLTRGEPRRDRVLFIDEGTIHTKLDVRWKEIPKPPIPPKEWFNRLVRGLDQENFLNVFLLSALGGRDVEDRATRMMVGKQRLIHLTAIIVSAVLILHGLRRLFKARVRFDTKVPLVANHLAQTMSTEPVLAQRHRGMMYEGNLGDASRALARQPFAAYAERASLQPPPRPRVTVIGGWSQRSALAKLVDRIWALAYGSKVVPVGRHGFLQLANNVEEVHVALTAGILKLEEPALPAGPYFTRPVGRAPAAL